MPLLHAESFIHPAADDKNLLVLECLGSRVLAAVEAWEILLLGVRAFRTGP
jgi:hypothetical protein